MPIPVTITLPQKLLSHFVHDLLSSQPILQPVTLRIDLPGLVSSSHLSDCEAEDSDRFTISFKFLIVVPHISLATSGSLRYIKSLLIHDSLEEHDNSGLLHCKQHNVRCSRNQEHSVRVAVRQAVITSSDEYLSDTCKGSSALLFHVHLLSHDAAGNWVPLAQQVAAAVAQVKVAFDAVWNSYHTGQATGSMPPFSFAVVVDDSNGYFLPAEEAGRPGDSRGSLVEDGLRAMVGDRVSSEWDILLLCKRPDLDIPAMAELVAWAAATPVTPTVHCYGESASGNNLLHFSTAREDDVGQLSLQSRLDVAVVSLQDCLVSLMHDKMVRLASSGVRLEFGSILQGFNECVSEVAYKVWHPRLRNLAWPAPEFDQYFTSADGPGRPVKLLLNNAPLTSWSHWNEKSRLRDTSAKVRGLMCVVGTKVEVDHLLDSLAFLYNTSDHTGLAKSFIRACVPAWPDAVAVGELARLEGNLVSFMETHGYAIRSRGGLSWLWDSFAVLLLEHRVRSLASLEGSHIVIPLVGSDTALPSNVHSHELWSSLHASLLGQSYDAGLSWDARVSEALHAPSSPRKQRSPSRWGKAEPLDTMWHRLDAPSVTPADQLRLAIAGESEEARLFAEASRESIQPSGHLLRKRRQPDQAARPGSERGRRPKAEVASLADLRERIAREADASENFRRRFESSVWPGFTPRHDSADF